MERWFDTGLMMEDGKTTIAVCAYNDIQAAKYLKNGWKPLAASDKKKTKVRKNEA